MINKSALFSDETAEFKSPYQPRPGDRVTLRLRTLRDDVTSALAYVNGDALPMRRTAQTGYFDLYEVSFTCPKEPVQYYFNVSDGAQCLWYSRLGCSEQAPREGHFAILPQFHIPEWAIGTLYYQIFTDRFCNGDKSNDVENGEYYYHGPVHRVKDWNALPKKLDVGNFYGGDLQGVMEKLDYLRSLGVETVYFNPLFLSPSNHKYDTQDYDYIDPHLAVITDDCPGTPGRHSADNAKSARYIRRVTSRANLEQSNAYFARLVEEMHRRGMRIVIDGVFNHCGSFNKWMDREGIYRRAGGSYAPGAFQSVDSPYRNYFCFSGNDRADASYEGWWDFPTLPKLNYEGSGELTEHMLDVAQRWVSAPYGADGWRLDMAADLGHSPEVNHAFWRAFRRRVRQANPEAVILAEHYGDPSAWLDGSQWDTVMNYDAFMEPVTWFLTGMEKHSDYFDGAKLNNGTLFFESMRLHMSRLPRPCLDAALNQLSNHDHSRFLTRTNRTVGRLDSAGAEAAGQQVDERVMRLAVLIQMTWPGSPGIYYGDEAGQVGWTDPDSRRTYPWGRENRGLLDFHRRAASLRKELHCLRRGSLIPLAAGDGYIAYGRFDREDCAVVVIHNGDSPLSLNLPVWMLNIPVDRRLEPVLSTASAPLPEIPTVSASGLMLTLPAKTGCVYRFRY